MAKEYYSAKEVDELLKAAKDQMIQSINSAVTMSSSNASPVKFTGTGIHIKVTRTERK